MSRKKRKTRNDVVRGRLKKPSKSNPFAASLALTSSTSSLSLFLFIYLFKFLIPFFFLIIIFGYKIKAMVDLIISVILGVLCF